MPSLERPAREQPCAVEPARLNARSSRLVVVVATYNRLGLLQRTLASIAAGTRGGHEVIVADGGSTDGTIEYLRGQERVTPWFQGRLLGTARCYNDVWRRIESRYTCWLSDDTDIVPDALDRAVGILEAEPDIGMVGLKMRDTAGPQRNQPYLGGVSEYGILTCNHGVLPTALLKALGYFNEAYRSYTIDADLTASVLCAGRRVVMTRDVSVLHHRLWAEAEGWDERMGREMGGIDNAAVYRGKFRFLAPTSTPGAQGRRWLMRGLEELLFAGADPQAVRLGGTRRDWRNVARGRFLPVSFAGRPDRPYHLEQQIPARWLQHPANPYRALAREAG